VRRLHTLLTCNWLAIGFHCWRKGHDWHSYTVCRRFRIETVEPGLSRAHRLPGEHAPITTCRYCGQYGGVEL
jgi:hypothetical protein